MNRVSSPTQIAPAKPFFFGAKRPQHRAQSQKVFFAVELTDFHEVVSRHEARPIQTTESRPPRGLA
jgi:hypothetical protein